MRHFVTVFSFWLLFLGNFFAFSQNASGLIPRAEFFKPDEKTQVQISPNGEWVGYLKNEKLVVVPAALPEQEQKVPTEFPVLEWQWSLTGELIWVENTPDGNRLLVLDSLGENFYQPQIKLKNAASIRIMALSQLRSREIAVGLQQEADDALTFHRINLENSKTSFIDSSYGFSRWFFDENLDLKAGTRRNGVYYSSIHYLNKKGKWLTLPGPDSLGIDTLGWPMQDVLSLSFDGNTLWYVSNLGQEFAVLKSLDLKSGKSTVEFTPPDHDLVWAGAVLDINNNKPISVVGYKSELVRHLLDPSISGDFQMIGLTHEGDISFAGRSSNDRYWLIRFMDGGPLEYYRYDKMTMTATPLFSVLPSLREYQLAERRPFEVKSRDGLDLHCRVFLPGGTDPDGDGVPLEPLPTVLYVHGGPWVAWLNNSWFANRNFQLLADRGYAVICAEFRGASGYGRIFVDRSRMEWGDKMQKDLVDIVNHAEETGISQKGKTGIWGWSYGGYATLASLAWHPEKYACGIGMYGVYDLKGFTERLGPETWWPRMVGNPQTAEGKAILTAHSPVNSANLIKKPLLLTHGGRDERVPLMETDQMFSALQESGRNDIPYFVFPEEPHDYRQAESWEAFWAIAERFLAENLGGRYQPVADELKSSNMEIRNGADWIESIQD